MWRMLAAAFAALVVLILGLGAYLSDKIYLRFNHRAPDDLTRSYEPGELKGDLEEALATIERIHPNFRSIVDEEFYQQRKEETLAALDRPMTRAAFYAVASAVNGAFADGHTYLMRPKEEWVDARRSVLAPPVIVRFDDDGVVVERSFGTNNIPNGSRLVSINGVSAAAIADWLVKRESGESIDVRRAYAVRELPTAFWLNDLKPPFRLICVPPGSADPVQFMENGVSLTAS